MAHSIEFKKLTCEVCNSPGTAEATDLGGGQKALGIPDGWRLIRGKKISFRCSKCWSDHPTGEFKLPSSEDAKLTTELRKLLCELCNVAEMAEATDLGEGNRAIRIPDGWRLMWGNKIGFRCNPCWHDHPTGEFKLSPSGRLKLVEDPQPKESLSNNESLP